MTENLTKEFTPHSQGAVLSPEVLRVRSIGQRPNQSGHFTPEDARGIYIRGYGVTSAQDHQPVLGTNGMGPCLAVAIYNPATKTGTLAHFDTNTKTSSIQTLIDAVRDHQDQKLEVHLAGGELGNVHSQRMVEEVVSRLNSASHVEIISADILNASGVLKSLSLDTRTGEIANTFMGRNLDVGDRQNIMSYHAIRASQEEALRPEYIHGTAFSAADWKKQAQEITPQPVVNHERKYD